MDVFWGAIFSLPQGIYVLVYIIKKKKKFLKSGWKTVPLAAEDHVGGDWACPGEGRWWPGLGGGSRDAKSERN